MTADISFSMWFSIVHLKFGGAGSLILISISIFGSSVRFKR